MKEIIKECRYDLISFLTLFARRLRDNGLPVGPGKVSDSVVGLRSINLIHKEKVYMVLLTIFLSKQEDRLLFDRLFHEFWGFKPDCREADSRSRSTEEPRSRIPETATNRIIRAISYVNVKREVVEPLHTRASINELVTAKNRLHLQRQELSEFNVIAASIVKSLTSRPARRLKRHKSKGVVDMRRILRQTPNTGDDFAKLPRRHRGKKVPRLLVLLDVSGSMDKNTNSLLQLIYAISKYTSRIETFVFSTKISRVTSILKLSSFEDAMDGISSLTPQLSGGTRIGYTIDKMNSDYRFLQTRYTNVIIVSDGWDTGEPITVSRALRSMKRRVQRIIWLNPLMETKDYEPLTRCLLEAKPFIDHFISSSSFSGLRKLARVLRH